MNKEQKPQNQEQESEGVIAFLGDWWERHPVVCGLILFFVIAAILIWLWFCVNKEFAKFFAYLIGGGLLFSQIVASSRRATAAEETAKAMHKTTELTEKGNIDERFKNAIEHLGHESSSIRLGGIYALHHIAQEVEEYRERVFEILCAHVRATTTDVEYKPRIEESGQTRPTIEIQSILNLLFVKTQGREIYRNLRVNLENANLSGIMLLNANLQGSNLSQTIWKHAGLWRGNLQKANLSYTSLQGAALSSTDLKGANLFSAKLQSSIFDKVDLRAAGLQETDLQDVDLTNAKNLTIAQLLKTKTLYKAKLPDGMEEEIRKQKPELLEKPANKPAI